MSRDDGRGPEDPGQWSDRTEGLPDADEVDRRVEAFLERRGEDEQRAAPDDEVTAVLRRLRSDAVGPLPTSSRDRHLAAIRRAERDGAGSSAAGATVRAPSPSRMGRLQRRLAPLTAAAAGLVLFAGGGTVALAQTAQPDDGLYGVKLASEQVWTAMPRGSERAAQAHLALAERRLDEARGAPHRADELVAAGLEQVEAAAEEDPATAIANFERLLGDGEDALPAQASPRARWALARNCHRIAEHHGIAHACPDPDRFAEHPGRGHDGDHPGRGVGPSGERGPRGWGPGGRPEGVEGPPPGVPGHGDEGSGTDEDG